MEKKCENVQNTRCTIIRLFIRLTHGRKPFSISWLFINIGIKPRWCGLFWLRNKVKQCIWKKFRLRSEDSSYKEFVSNTIDTSYNTMNTLYQIQWIHCIIWCIHRSLWCIHCNLQSTMYPSYQNMMETLFVVYKTNQCEKKLYCEAKQSLCILYNVLIDYDVKNTSPWLNWHSINILRVYFCHQFKLL